MIALSTASLVGFAQSPVKFGIGVDAQFPIGDFGDVSSFGIGGSVQANYTLDPTLDLTLQAGYINFNGKDIPNTNLKFDNSGVIPVLAGIEYNFTPQVFASGQLGAGFGTEKNSNTSFVYAPGIGYKFTPNFNLLLKYTGYSAKSTTSSTVGVRLGYTF